MQWISRIALIAYLAGGWIIPATHRHDHASQVPAGLNSAEFADSVFVAESCGCQGRQAACVRVAPQDSSGEANQDNVETLVQGSHANACGGLCAICSARTLCSTQEDLVNDGYLLIPAVGDRVYASIYLTCAFHLSGNLSSRGPPVNL